MFEQAKHPGTWRKTQCSDDCPDDENLDWDASSEDPDTGTKVAWQGDVDSKTLGAAVDVPDAKVVDASPEQELRVEEFAAASDEEVMKCFSSPPSVLDGSDWIVASVAFRKGYVLFWGNDEGEDAWKVVTLIPA